MFSESLWYTYLELGLVAQLVRAPPCHGGGRGSESHPGRFVSFICYVGS